jgi:radical SAM protein with 4Fe4S-binding SPASM domain
MKKKLSLIFDRLNGNKTSWCGYLITSVYINPDGNVFSCCNYSPAILGNIKNESLDDIWNGKKIKKFRKLNNNGLLQCAKNCKILDYPPIKSPDKNEYKKAEQPFRNLNWLFIEFGLRCNIRCIMCNQDHKDKRELDWQLLKDSIDYKNIRLVSVQGGEPLCIKNAKEYIKWISSKGIKLQMLTNGTIMNDEMAESLMKNGNDVFISINAATPEIHEAVNKGSKWKRVMGSIEKLDEFRSVSGSGRIIGHMTIVPENIHEIPLFINKFGNYIFDEINFCYDSQTIPTLLKEKSDFFNSLKINIEKSMCQISPKTIIDVSQLKLLNLV